MGGGGGMMMGDLIGWVTKPVHRTHNSKKRHPLAKVKGGWSNEEDMLLAG